MIEREIEQRFRHGVAPPHPATRAKLVVRLSTMPSVHAVILAGGSGTRFWPASRRSRPKQLLALAGASDESLIAATVRRLHPLIEPADVWVATSTTLLEATALTLPQVPRAHLLAEPVRATPPPPSAGLPP